MSDDINITTNKIKIAALSGLAAVISTVLCWYFNVITYDVQLGKINTQKELIQFYKDWNEKDVHGLCEFICAFQWLTVPLLIYFVEILVAMQKNILNMPYLQERFVRIFNIILIVTFTLIPVPLVVGRTFEWDFEDESGDIIISGYFIQLAMVRLCIVLLDSCMIPLMALSINHWYLVITKNKDNKCNACWLILSFFILFGGLIQLFGWAENGFFSVHGSSQYFSCVVFVSFIAVSIWMFLNRNKEILVKYQRVHLQVADVN
eukprot:263262_1